MGKAAETVAVTLYTKDSHFIMELIQNGGMLAAPSFMNKQNNQQSIFFISYSTYVIQSDENEWHPACLIHISYMYVLNMHTDDSEFPPDVPPTMEFVLITCGNGDGAGSALDQAIQNAGACCKVSNKDEEDLDFNGLVPYICDYSVQG